MRVNPRWFGAGGPGISNAERLGVGISFDCPCGQHGDRAEWEQFANPLDGRGPYRKDGHAWERTGDTFETLSGRLRVARMDHRRMGA